LKREVRFRLIRHLDFLENELKDYDRFKALSWENYNNDRSCRRDVERWVENIVNSSIDIAKIILMNEEKILPDTYRAIIKNLSIISDFKELNTERLSRLVILRYVISHEYLDIRWSSIKKFILETESLYRDLLDKVRSYIERKIKEEGEE
jgi:uncharacterized protein YutE (UPF0331/DUF86 family)